MKTEPTDLDREAARLFRLEQYMRFHDGQKWGRTANPAGCGYSALDMKDPPTIGECLSQMLEKAKGCGIRPDFGVSGANAPGEMCGRLSFWLRFSADTYEASVSPPTPEQSDASRTSIGAALVAAMRALNGAAAGVR